MSSNPAIVIGVSAVNTADAELKKLDDKVRETTGIVETEGNKMASVTSSTTEKVKKNYLNIAGSVASLGAGLVGFATSFSTLERAQTRSDQATLTYQRSLSRLNDMIAEGGHSADELAQQQEKVRINADKAKQSQDNLNDTYTNFLANIPSQFINFGYSASNIYDMVKKNQQESGETVKESSKVYSGALTLMKEANIKTAASTSFLDSTVKKVFLSNPYILPIIATSAVVTALAFNVGGLRDRTNEFGKAIGDAIPALRPLLDAIGSLQNVFGGATEKSKDLTDTTYDLGDAADATKKHIQTYSEYLADVADKTGDASRQNLYFLQASGQLASGLTLTNDQLALAATYLKDHADDTNKTTQANFDLVASVYGLNTALQLNNGELGNLADALTKAKKAQDAAKNAADDEKEAQRKATEAIQERVKANVELARSMGVQINLHTTTVDQTDRISEHLQSLQSDYETARKNAEDFAIANGVNVVTAVKATDGQLVNIIGTLAQTKAGSADTARSVVQDFLMSKKAVDQYSKSAGDSGLAITALGNTSHDTSAQIKDATAFIDEQSSKTFNNFVIGAQASLLAIAALQDRALVSQFGQVGGIAGTVSTDALTAAGFGNNASLMQSAASGRLGGVFTPGGRVLDTGGTLYEDVIGIGKDTGTPHYLHKNELVIPPSKLGRLSAVRNDVAGHSKPKRGVIFSFKIGDDVIATAKIPDMYAVLEGEYGNDIVINAGDKGWRRRYF
ncbi:hypothetical protein NTE_02111 [Candidatus Nitrososphaera evergladensis SR1]|uniref:Uncharacterized protein n=1 Tax=Candidatus Nitrososphaera evergladensis SR1 TaxID=1459636 RepID=A0A075MRJ7_9ARCH|nr:hypothetical protein [Candidatus Nitrososphaera evergladensis]AIF84166.1 hypothetical protein NTE_02111 [Candidatus Nitrososphaera evergladensis SR1]